VLLKSKHRKRDLGFFIAVFGFTLLIETIIYVFLRAYEYYPYIIPNSPKNDGVLGNLISQFSISSVTLLVCVFKIPFRGMVLASGCFYFIEKLFLDLGIYKHHWYSTWITFLGLIVIFKLTQKWYAKVITKENKLINYITIIIGALSLYLPTTNWIGILSGYYEIKDNILVDPYISHAVVTIPKYFIQIITAYFLYIRKANWLWNLAAFAVLLAADIVLYYTKFMYVKDGFLFLYSLISFSTSYLYVYIMKNLLYKP
jgi:hypothetical protein